MYTVKIARVPEKLKALRKARGLSQEELAKKVGTNQPTISRMERSKKDLQDLEVLALITEALDASISIDIVPKKVNLERISPK